MDEAESATELAKRVNVLDAISWLHSAWAGVTEDCVRKFFAKCGFHPVGDALPVEQESAPDNNTLVLLGDVEWNDFVGMDDAIHTTAIHDDDWEAALVAKANGDVPDDEDCADEEEGADEEEPPARPTLSARDAMSSVKDLLDFARVANDAAMIDAATSLENIVEMHCVKQAATARQTTMLEFFQRQLTWCVIQPPCIQHTVQHTRVFTCMHYPVNKYCCFSHIFSCVRFISHCIQYCH